MNSSAANTQKPFKLLDLRLAKEILVQLKPEPIGVWMCEQGFDPDKGGVLYLPKAMRDDWPFPPKYVRFTDAIGHPVLAWDPCLYYRHLSASKPVF